MSSASWLPWQGRAHVLEEVDHLVVRQVVAELVVDVDLDVAVQAAVASILTVDAVDVVPSGLIGVATSPTSLLATSVSSM